VSGKFDNRDDTWLKMRNGPGEWCVAYHGTLSGNVSKIMETPLRPGNRNAYGVGIYCSPDITACEPYFRPGLVVPTDAGSIRCQYAFMCHVNTRSIHHCPGKPCDKTKDDQYTLHMTHRRNYWFVNGPNDDHQNIRTYGLLVKEVK
jgi:hypothetical protein